MRVAIKLLLCVFLFTRNVFSENGSNDYIKENTKMYQNGFEEISKSVLEEILVEYKRLREDVLSLKTSQDLMQAELNELKEKQKESVKRITDIEEENLILRKENSKILKLTQDVQTKIHYQNANLKQNQTSKRLLNTAVGLPGTYQVAFSTLMTHNIDNPHDNEIFMFDNIILNSGNAYNKNNGMFTAPVKGIYAFFATILTFSGKSLESQIVRNGRNFCNIYSGDDTFDGSGSNMAITHLEVGDAVWVRIHDRFHDTGVSVDGPFTTFSGFLLYETD